MEKHVLSVTVNNKFGVLTRISGLFARRGYNITSLTVGETQNPEISRMTIVFMGDDYTNTQLQNQLKKIIDVTDVVELYSDSSVCRELYLIKIKANDKNRAAVLQLAELFRAKTVDVNNTTLIFELTGDNEKLDAFFDNMKKYGILEISRTGLTAMSRGAADGI